MRLTLLALIAIAPLAFGFFAPASASAQCGPGDHWIDGCGAGVDNMDNTGALIGLDLDGDCVVDDNIIFFGDVSIDRSAALDDSIFFPGTRPVDAHIDVIDTEIVSMSLTGEGHTLLVGSGLGINPLAPSRGNIAEQSVDNRFADSFFDVFFEITTPSLALLYNHVPLQLTDIIDQVPPRGVYEHPVTCLDLFTLPVGGTDTGINLVTAQHNTATATSPALSMEGLLVFLLIVTGVGVFVQRRRRGKVV